MASITLKQCITCKCTADLTALAVWSVFKSVAHMLVFKHSRNIFLERINICNSQRFIPLIPFIDNVDMHYYITQ